MLIKNKIIAALTVNRNSSLTQEKEKIYKSDNELIVSNKNMSNKDVNIAFSKPNWPFPPM